MVARPPLSHCRHSPMPSCEGAPRLAKASHAICIWRDSVSAAGPPPEKNCTTGMCTAPNTNGSSSAWVEPSMPSNAGDSQSKR